MAQLLERGALPKSLPAVRFGTPLGAGFSYNYHVSPLSILGHCFLGQGTLPSHASRDSGVNEYLVGKRWKCVRQTQWTEMAAGLYALCGVEMALKRMGPMTGGGG